MKRLFRFFLFVTALTALSGCANVRNIRLTEDFWKNQKRGVVVAKVRFANKPCLYTEGSQGLLDLAINAIASKKFDTYLAKTSLDWYNELPKKFVAHLKQRHISAKIYPSDISKKQTKNPIAILDTDADKLLLLELENIGAIRTYYSFMPTSAPRAFCVLRAELRDGQDNKVLWRHSAKIEESVPGAWDQPPTYPNFTVTLQKAIEEAQEEVINSFFSGH